MKNQGDVPKTMICPAVPSNVFCYYGAPPPGNDNMWKYSYTMSQGVSFSPKYEPSKKEGRPYKMQAFTNPVAIPHIVDGVGVASYDPSKEANINPNIGFTGVSSGRKIDYRHSGKVNILTFGGNVVSVKHLNPSEAGIGNPTKQQVLK